MNYEQAEAYLLDLELFGMRFGLDRMHKLMTVLGMPQRRFASVHVVGSNGKSSTARMIAAILERHVMRTGTYISPHLRSFSERIEVGEEPIGDADFAAAITRVARRCLERYFDNQQHQLATKARRHEERTKKKNDFCAGYPDVAQSRRRHTKYAGTPSRARPSPMIDSTGCAIIVLTTIRIAAATNRMGVTG